MNGKYSREINFCKSHRLPYISNNNNKQMTYRYVELSLALSRSLSSFRRVDPMIRDVFIDGGHEMPRWTIPRFYFAREQIAEIFRGWPTGQRLRSTRGMPREHVFTYHATRGFGFRTRRATLVFARSRNELNISTRSELFHHAHDGHALTLLSVAGSTLPRTFFPRN